MYFTIPVKQLFVYIVLLSHLPCVIEILLDRPVKKENLMNHLRENEARFARMLLGITNYQLLKVHTPFNIFYVFFLCHLEANALFPKSWISVLIIYHLLFVKYDSYHRRDISLMFMLPPSKP